MNLRRVKGILASRIRTLRNSKGWTQEHLAEEVDIHTTYLSRIESGKKLPTLIIICKIADVLGVDTCELFMDEAKKASFDYKRKKLISIVNESRPAVVDVYSILLAALHKRYKKCKKIV